MVRFLLLLNCGTGTIQNNIACYSEFGTDMVMAREKPFFCFDVGIRLSGRAIIIESMKRMLAYSSIGQIGYVIIFNNCWRLAWCSVLVLSV